MATGHIRKNELKSGKASYSFIVETEADLETGKRQRIYKTFKTKKEAEKAMQETMAKINNHSFVKDSKITVKAFLLEWLEVYIKPHMSPTTTDSYVTQVEKYIIPALGNKKLQDLKTVDIQKFYNQLKEKSPLSGKPLSAKTIKNIHMNLQAALDKAVEDEIITKNPAKKVELQKAKKYQADVYNMEDILEVFKAAKDTDLELAIHILLLLGLRRGELLALRWVNVDFQNGYVNIVENAVRIGKSGKTLIKAPKSESGVRKIQVPSSLLKMMKKSRAEYWQNRMKHGKDFNDTDLVVCQENGSPYTVGYFSQKVQRFIKRNGLKKVRLHDYRHTCATQMLRLGISPKVAQKQLGHSSFGITMDTYSHVLEEMELEAADIMERAIYSNALSG